MITPASPATGGLAAGPSRLRVGVAVLGVWLVIGAAASGLSYANWARERFPITLWGSLGVMMPIWMYWALATPPVAWFTRRFPPIGSGWPRRLLAHVAVASLLHLGASAVSAQANVVFFPVPNTELRFGSMFSSYATTRWPFNVLIYAAVVGAWLTLDAWRRLREREVHASRLEAQLAQAQLSALRMQLNPHFLFNALQAISTLVAEDPRRARRTLTLLGDLLRAVLDGGGGQEIPLREELVFLRRYLEIEQTRFPDRLTVTFDVDEPTLELMVPSFLLQPLVENAIRYAIAPRAEPGRIVVRARSEHGTLRLEVRDDGPGPPPGEPNGVGLATTRARLEKLYGAAQQFRLVAGPSGGAVAAVELPARSAGAARV